MESFFFSLLGIVVIIGFIGLLIYSEQQFYKIQSELYKLVKQSGAQSINIERKRQFGEKGVYRFIVSFRDAKGKRQKRLVSRHIGGFGAPAGDFLWDKPLLDNEQEKQLSARLGSKEQIISEMDAEIKRLQEELALIQKET